MRGALTRRNAHTTATLDTTATKHTEHENARRRSHVPLALTDGDVAGGCNTSLMRRMIQLLLCRQRCGQRRIFRLLFFFCSSICREDEEEGEEKEEEKEEQRLK